MSDLPTLVFTHGAWHRPTCYKKVMKALREQHHIRCTSFQLPSATGDPKVTFKDDLDAARATIASETTEGHDVVLVAHSYGGIVANSAIKYFTKPQPTQGRVVGLVLIASGFSLTGLSFMDPLFHIPPPAWRVNQETGFAELAQPPRQLFYHDLPADEADEWVAQLMPQSLKALFEGGEHAYAGWRDVPAWYIGTVEDQGLPVAVQRVNVGMAREMGATVEHRELNSSHSPFLSQPDEVVHLLVEATRAFTGKTVVDVKADSRMKEILTPAASIWKPSSWLKYGLPLMFGRILGRCVLTFYGTFILLHGRGSWAEKFAPALLQTRIQTPQPSTSEHSQCETSIDAHTDTSPDHKPGTTLQTAFPHARFVFPTAARRRATLYKRALTRQWFDNWNLDPLATEREELQIEGLRETTLYLHQLLRSEIAIVPGGANNVVLGGLSQGCAASLVALLLWEGDELGAMVGMCGRLPFAESLIAEARGEEKGHVDVDELGFDPFAVDACDPEDLGNKTADTPVQRVIGWLRQQLDLPALEASPTTLSVQKVPIFLGHGAQDEKVSIELGRRAAQCLDSLGAGVCWKEYDDLGHWYSQEMLGDMIHFLHETLDRPQSPE